MESLCSYVHVYVDMGMQPFIVFCFSLHTLRASADSLSSWDSHAGDQKPEAPNPQSQHPLECFQRLGSTV